MVEGKKHLPDYLQNGFFKKLLKNNFSIIITYYIFQSSLHTDRRETAFKVGFTIFFSLLLLPLLNPLSAILIAHLLNAVFNGHIPAMLIHMGIGGKSPENFIQYMEKIQARLAKENGVSHAYAYGSLSRNVYKPTSDLDIRIVPKSNKWLTCFFYLTKERTLALFNWFPLDIYAFEPVDLKMKMRSDEVPISFKSLAPLYHTEMDFHDFRSSFKQNVVK